MENQLKRIIEQANNILTLKSTDNYEAVSDIADALVETAIELQGKVENYVLKSEIKTLREENEALKARVEALTDEGNEQ